MRKRIPVIVCLLLLMPTIQVAADGGDRSQGSSSLLLLAPCKFFAKGRGPSGHLLPSQLTLKRVQAGFDVAHELVPTSQKGKQKQRATIWLARKGAYQKHRSPSGALKKKSDS